MENVEKIKLMLVDDDEYSIQSIKNTINYNFPQIEIVAEAMNVKDAISIINHTKPELLILDIMLPDGYGFDILQSTTYKDYEVIITSSYPDYAIRAYQYSALHFLQKPISMADFGIAIGRYKHFNSFEKLDEKIKIAKSIINNNPTNIMLPSNDGLIMHKLDDIAYFESVSNYVKISFTDGREKTITKNLQKIHTILENTQFFRIHNSYLVNLNQIQSYHKGKSAYIITKNQKIIPIALGKKENFLEKLKNFAKVI